jgi:hypothetical protein
MAHLIKDKTMARTQGNDGARYQLAREGAYNVQSFGPCMTLAQAQAYQADMALANVPVLVVRCNAQ